MPNRRTRLALILILSAIPATIAAGIFLLNDRHYYIVALLVIGWTTLPFLLVFERRQPRARELVVLSVLTAIAVAGRAAFFMIPQFKPITAIVIVTGATLGPEAGFLVGAMSGFVSNFFFGQGPWTPWQMFAFGVIGFLAGLVFRRGRLPRRVFPLIAFGAVATFVVYGLLMDTCTIFLWTDRPTWAYALTVYASGVPFNLMHAASTVIFLAVLAKPMVEKIQRLQVKYGLIEPVVEPA
ncbi:MAG: ECF transporter S component [Propionibacteriaceae bacterium]|jgi:energy-coupling factor transport system substrate-specific component|nr:ECF transporter S component [Propionibacteriaceae bacterium]